MPFLCAMLWFLFSRCFTAPLSGLTEKCCCSADESTLFSLRNHFFRRFLRGSVGVQLSSFFPFYFQALAGVTDSSPQVRGQPPTRGTLWTLHQALSYTLRMAGCPFPTAEVGGGGVCVPCASDRGERIMGKQRASLPLSMLCCTSRSLAPPPPEPLGKDGEDAVVSTLWIWTRFNLWPHAEFQKTKNVFIASGKVSTAAALTKFKLHLKHRAGPKQTGQRWR